MKNWFYHILCRKYSLEEKD